MMRSQTAVRILFAAATAVLACAATQGPALATVSCPSGADTCLFVNSNLDTNARDGGLTLTEALALDNGELTVQALTPAERAQVATNSERGLGRAGQDRIYFDPAVFCAGCDTQVIVLSPPAIGGQKIMAPPAIGGQGVGGDTWLGLGWDAAAGAEVAAPVVIDGSLLGSSSGVLVLTRDNWLRGLHFRNFAGAAIEMSQWAAGRTRIGANGDGQLDDAEGVTYTNVATPTRIGQS